jgi:hypothetical protein
MSLQPIALELQVQILFIINTDSFNYSVDLGPNDTTLCNGTTLFLYAGPKHLSYSWSNGSTHNSLTVTSPGKYYVTMTNCLNNITTDTINVFYKQSPIFSLGNDTTVCYNLNSLVLESIYSDSTTYLFAWSSGASTASITPNHSGQYWLNVTNNYFCSYADTINIIIDSTLSLVSLGPDDSLCSGNLITLTQGMSPSLTYTWSTSSNNDSLLITNTGQYSVIVTNTNNCVAKDTIDITILGFAPTANFSSNIGCVNQIVSFTDLSIPPSGNTISNYEWNFGDLQFSNKYLNLYQIHHILIQILAHIQLV